MNSLALEPTEPPAGDTGARAPADADRAPRRLIGIALAAGLTLELGLRGGVSNAVVAAGLVLVVLALITDGRVRRREARPLAVAALVPVAFLAVRASPWLAASNLGAAAALIGTSVLYSQSGSVLDATPGRLIERGLSALGRSAAVGTVVRAAVPDLAPRERDRLTRVALALLVTVPMLALLVTLLASADAVFASFLTPDVGLGPIAGHAFLTLVLAPMVLCLALAASAPVTDRDRSGGFGAVEVVTMLALAAVVLGLFVVSQLVALTDAGQRVVESAGLTPAEYARSGFFQLCWATGLLLGFLGLVRALATPEALEQRPVRWLGAAVPALALGLVVVSLRRMALYDRAFGLTMLRLWVVGAAVWMGSVLVMTVVRNLGQGSGRRWLVAGAGVAALALVLVADIADPEAFVARHNIERARQGAELDGNYLASLSPDAVPTIAGAIEDADDPWEQDDLVVALECRHQEQGAAALNLAKARAAEARRDVCPTLDVPSGT
jgi:hypothetical protein